MPLDGGPNKPLNEQQLHRHTSVTRQVSHSQEKPLFLRICTAVFYGLASIMIMVVNKEVLTVHKFPSFLVLGLGQMVATIVLLQLGKWLRWITFPNCSRDTFKKLWPLQLLYVGNMLSGLGGTQELSLPMLTVLRRFSILMTMIGEWYLLKVVANTPTQLSVYLMIFGAIVAAFNDLAFNLKGYLYVLLNDFCTAANGVVTKKKLDAKDLGKYGMMYYNSLFVFLPTLAYTWWIGDLDKCIDFEGWTNPNPVSGTPSYMFTVKFILSCGFGFILMFSTVLCTQYNSALTTTIVGCLKNILITYCGMLIGGDYIFSWPNFTGLTISVIGSLIYAKITFRSSSSKTSTLPMVSTSSALK